jgi:hypothetical protein
MDGSGVKPVAPYIAFETADQCKEAVIDITNMSYDWNGVDAEIRSR